MKKKFKTFCLICLLIIGIGFASYPVIQQTKNQPTSQSIVITDEEKENMANLGDLLGRRQNAYELAIIGLIAIPELNLHLPIFEGDDEKQLQNGVGSSGNSNFDSANFSLAAHHVFGSEEAKNWLFSPLTRAQKGMEVFLADEKNIYKYVISESLHVTVHDIDVLDEVPGQRLLTMIYCTHFSSDERTIVRANFVSQQTISQTEIQLVSHFTGAWSTIPVN